MQMAALAVAMTVVAAWMCGAVTGARAADKQAAKVLEAYMEYMWSLASKANDLDDFKARLLADVALDVGEKE